MIPRFGRADVLAVLLFLLVSVHYAVASITLAASAPLWMDEVLAVRTARLTDPAAIWHALVHGAEFSPPLYDMLLGRLHALGVDTPIGWRLPSIVAGYAAAIALGSIAWRRYGRVPAALAAGIVLSSGLFAYAVQARPYALLIAVFALALAIRERPAGAQPSPRRCALLALLLVVMVALHFYALLLVAVLVAIELAERRPPSRGVLAASAVAAASIAAWLPILVAAHHYSGADTGAPGYYARPTLDALLSSYALTLGWPALLLLGLLIIVALRRARALPVLPHQESALRRAGEALDQVRPDGARDLNSAFHRDPVLIGQAAEGKTGGAARAMAEERRVRLDPDARADRFVESWRGLAREQAGGDQVKADKAATRMGAMAKDLRRDPELAKALERRAPELELKLERGRSIERSLEQSIGIGRERDRGMSR